MITGVHFLLYTRDAEADRAFFRDVLKLQTIDAGDGWLIFALPPAELAFHPAGKGTVQPPLGGELPGSFYLMCDDVRSMIETLRARNVTCTEVTDAGWGLATSVRLPSGGTIGLYQPTHPIAIDRGLRA